MTTAADVDALEAEYLEKVREHESTPPPLFSAEDRSYYTSTLPTLIAQLGQRLHEAILDHDIGVYGELLPAEAHTPEDGGGRSGHLREGAPDGDD